MANPIWWGLKPVRWVVLGAGILGGAAVSGGTSAAVLPPLEDAPGLSAGLGGPRRALLGQPSAAGLAGQWAGKSSDGRAVLVTLEVHAGEVTGTALLTGLVPDAQASPVPLKQPTLVGRTVSFVVAATGCDKTLTTGAFTLVSRQSGRLDVQPGAGRDRVSIQLTRIG